MSKNSQNYDTNKTGNVNDCRNANNKNASDSAQNTEKNSSRNKSQNKTNNSMKDKE